MKSRSRVAVVILNWNGRHYLEKFLPSVIAHSEPLAEVIVADNASTDDSVEWLELNFPSTRIIKLEQNYGFAGGYNRALEQVEAKYFILLNSDIEVSRDWIEPMIEVMEGDDMVAAVQPKILSYSYNRFFEYAGASGGFIDILGYPFCRGRLIGECEQDDGQYDESREIFWATGAAMMVRADLYFSSGGLDENFFAHQEEIDLCWRFKRQGYRIVVVPGSKVFHVGAGTLPIWSPKKTYLNFRNNIAMLYKNMTLRRFAVVYLIRMATDFARAFSYLLTFKVSFMLAIFRGHRDFWRFRSSLNRHKEYSFSRVTQVYGGSIVLRYIFVSKRFGKLM